MSSSLSGSLACGLTRVPPGASHQHRARAGGPAPQRVRTRVVRFRRAMRVVYGPSAELFHDSTVASRPPSLVNCGPRAGRRPLKVKPFAESGERTSPGECERPAPSSRGIGLHRHQRVKLGCDYTDPSRLPRAGLSPNHDLDIVIERRQQVHQSFDGEALQLVTTNRRNLRLRHS